MQYYIYKITNKLNGKAYVGQHKVRPGERFLRYMGKGIAIRAAIGKYGRENFTKEILEEIDDDEKHEFTSERERHWIAVLNTMQPNGYNLSPGGEGGCTREAAAKGVATRKARGYNRHSEETRRKMSDAAKGRSFSEKHKQHLSDHHHLKMQHVIVFEDGHEEITSEAMNKIAKRFGTTQNTLLRHSSRKKFVNGIMLKNIDPQKYACCNAQLANKKDEQVCRDPIRNDICTYRALRQRKWKHPDLYKNININAQIRSK